MPITIEIITPDRRVFEDVVDSVVVPTEAGEVGVLPAHIPLLSVLSPGEVRIEKSGKAEFIAVDQGFLKVEDDVVSLLTEAAVDVKDIDLAQVEEAEARARKTLEEARSNPDLDPVEIEQMERIIRFSVTQKLSKSRH